MGGSLWGCVTLRSAVGRVSHFGWVVVAVCFLVCVCVRGCAAGWRAGRQVCRQADRQTDSQAVLSCIGKRMYNSCSSLSLGVLGCIKLYWSMYSTHTDTHAQRTHTARVAQRLPYAHSIHTATTTTTATTATTQTHVLPFWALQPFDSSWHPRCLR